VAFAGVRLRGRVVGLGGMAAGALVALLAARPASAATWWMAAAGALTLAGLLVFALTLVRWSNERSGTPPVLDEEPP
jgi:hypothetical protein